VPAASWFKIVWENRRLQFSDRQLKISNKEVTVLKKFNFAPKFSQWDFLPQILYFFLIIFEKKSHKANIYRQAEIWGSGSCPLYPRS